MTKIIQRNWDHPDFRELISLLDGEFRERYGAVQDEYDRHNTTGPATTILVAYEDEKAVGCGAFRVFDEKTVEIKRMFVRKEYRGKGISKLILNRLEEIAADMGYSTAVLETGIKQQEAIALYKKSGYTQTEKYGPYANLEFSICMSKKIEDTNSELKYI
jgi:putative acetyltransferase